MKRFVKMLAIVAILTVGFVSTTDAGGRALHHGHRHHGHWHRPSVHWHRPSVHWHQSYHHDYYHWTPYRGWHSHRHYHYTPHYTSGHFHW